MSCYGKPFQSEADFMRFDELFALINTILDYAEVSDFFCVWTAATNLLAGFANQNWGSCNCLLHKCE